MALFNGTPILDPIIAPTISESSLKTVRLTVRDLARVHIVSVALCP